jgi:hypothetical protein
MHDYITLIMIALILAQIYVLEKIRGLYARSND